MPETLIETASALSAKRPADSLGAMLVARGLVTQDDIDKALAARQSPDQRLGDVLVRQGLLDETDLLSASSQLLGYGIADETTLPKAADVIDCANETRISLEWLCDRDALIWRGPQGEIFCTARDPLNSLLQEAIERAAPLGNARYFFTRARLVDALIETIRQTIAQERAATGNLRDLAEDAPTITFVDGIISEAARDQASDIHIEPDERQLTVRFRIDGVLRTRSIEPRSRYDAIASRLKLLSGMDIAERRLPQDGRISRRIGGEKIDFRVSTLPGAHGESIVMRLLRGQRQLMTLTDLGMENDHYDTLRRLIHSPHGVILVSGPTGSGKTTSLYAAIQDVKDGKKKLVTVEDPIEYMMEGVTQVQVRSDIGYDFARALRSILRQDPDVIMIGEIRDQETARIAIQAALTGHLVFSTVHTNDALSSISRLVDMGIEPFLLAAAVRGVVAQRLVRRVQPDKVEPYRPEAAVLERLPPGTPQNFVRPKGDAGDSAYSGRVAVYEMIAMDDALAQAVSRGASVGDMRTTARQGGMRTLLEDALIKAARGQTTVAEALRVAAEETT